MKSRQVFIFFILLLSFLIFACKPDKVEVLIYPSDIQSVLKNGIIETPTIITFKMLGEDKQGLLPKVKLSTLKYLSKDSEFKFSKGGFGDIMVIKSKLPMGTKDALSTYTKKNPRLASISIVKGKNGWYMAELNKTEYLDQLDNELTGINMMLGADFPPQNTIITVISDLKDEIKLAAIAVFVDGKPELVFTRKVKKRDNLRIEYKGGNGCVYSQISPQVNINFGSSPN